MYKKVRFSIAGMNSVSTSVTTDSSTACKGDNMKAELWPHNPDRRTEVPVKENPLWWQKQGLQYTRTGFGGKIPTSYMVQHQRRWYRVYCMIYGNSGSLYIISKGERIPVDIWRQ